MRTTIEMAKECDLVAGNAEHGIYLMALQRFAELVRADERARMADQPAQQEPVAWMHEWIDGEKIPLLRGRDGRKEDQPKTVRPLVYGDTSPPAQRTWVGLTDKERNSLWREIIGWGDPSHDDEDLMKAIEDASRRKNT